MQPRGGEVRRTRGDSTHSPKSNGWNGLGDLLARGDSVPLLFSDRVSGGHRTDFHIGEHEPSSQVPLRKLRCNTDMGEGALVPDVRSIIGFHFVSSFRFLPHSASFGVCLGLLAEPILWA